MGGRALKKTFTRRYSRVEFDKVSKELINILEKTFVKAETPLFFRNKETFGDIDIIVNKEISEHSRYHEINVREYIQETFKPNEIFHNGNAYSFDYKEVQVDMIMVESEDFDSNYHYLAYNDLGNFIGRLAQILGLKYGQEGLFYYHYSDNGGTKTKIIVSKDYKKIFEFLNLDYNKWLEGFDTLEEIFEYVTTSSLFNPDKFQLDELNKINRDRNLKRASYMSFLEYIKDKNPHENYDEQTFNLLRENVVPMIDNIFPEANIRLEIAQIEYEEAKRNLVKRKFSGTTIIKEFGLTGAEIGESLKKFREYVKLVHDMDVNDFIVKHNQDYVINSFKVANVIK